jgi:hypothetical protein
MRLAAKVNAFQAEIGRNQRFPSPGKANDGAIIANAAPDMLAGAHAAANTLDELAFDQRQMPSLYRDWRRGRISTPRRRASRPQAAHRFRAFSECKKAPLG